MSDKNIIAGFLDGLRPEPLLTVSEWSDRFRMLSSEASAEPGRWRTDRTPYLREIMDKLSALDPCEEVIVQKGAQLGFTEMGFNFVGYVVDIAPGPMLYVLPTEAMGKRNSKTRLTPMIESTPRLREKIAPAKSRTSANTTLQKDYPGGTLVIAGANSAAPLRNMPVRFLVLDEVDAYPLDLDGEGSPVDLAIKRTATFSKRKIYKLSTPTDDASSVIAGEFLNTDQRYFYVPCPECGAAQKLEFQYLRWERGKPETARYECAHCSELIHERFKTKMLQAGEWRAEKPELSSARKAGYHINSLYSPYGWYSWEQAAREYEDAKGNEPKLKVFTNTVLGETYKLKGDVPAWENLYNRREPYDIGIVPEGVSILTMGVDVQGDRLELEIVGWCPGRESYSIDYRVLLGNTAEKPVWEELRGIIEAEYPRDGGGSARVMLAAIDSGYNTSHVYDFCKTFQPGRVIPIKGKTQVSNVMVSPPRAIKSSRNNKHSGLSVWIVNVGMVKSEVYGYLRLEADETGKFPAGYCHFPQYDQHYFKMLTAEQLQQKRNSKGYTVYEWHKVFERNEALDCRVYARAAANVCGVDAWGDEEWERVKSGAVAAHKKKKRKSNFW